MSVHTASVLSARAGGAPPPRVVPARRRSAPMAALGVALVVIGALAGWRYAASADGPRQAYLAVARPVAAGARIQAADLRTVSLAPARGLSPVAVSRSGTVIGKYAAVDLVPGTLLTPADVTAKREVAAGQALVGLDLPADRRPGRTLRPGEHVLLVAVPPQDGNDPALAEFEDGAPPGTSSGGSALPPNLPATVVEVGPTDAQGAAVIDVAIPVGDVAGVTAYASRDLVAIVVVPGN